MRPHPLACTVPPAFVYATGGISCRFIADDPDPAASRRGQVRYCGQPRAHARTMYCRAHLDLCVVLRTPRATDSAIQRRLTHFAWWDRRTAETAAQRAAILDAK